MKKSNRTIKLSHRLQQIEAQISVPYNHIWDCCCDHGLLGLSLLDKKCAKTVHFVDVVPDLLNKIESTLLQYWQGFRDDWQVHCIDAANLPIAQYADNKTDSKHLIIIAGIGGDLMIELLSSLHWITDKYQVEFILCPVHHNYKVREYLIAHGFRLIKESLVFENKRGYEILHIATQADLRLTVTGSTMWDFNNRLHLDYLNKIIQHYQRLAKNPINKVDSIIKQYQQLLPTVES
jgi:tRNA (adenine22-N1)-methyltransferase